MSVNLLNPRSCSTGGRVAQASSYSSISNSDDRPAVFYEPAYHSTAGRTTRHLSHPPDHSNPSWASFRLSRHGQDRDGRASSHEHVSPAWEQPDQSSSSWSCSETLQNRTVACPPGRWQQQQQQLARPLTSVTATASAKGSVRGHTHPTPQRSVNSSSGQAHPARDVGTDATRVWTRLVTPGGSMELPAHSHHLPSGAPRITTRYSSHSPISSVRRKAWHRNMSDAARTPHVSGSRTPAVLRKVDRERSQVAYRVPAEFLVGDPWKGCDDIVHEDLVSWFMECIVAKNHTWTSELVDEIMSAVEADSGNDMSKECFPAKHISPAWPHWGDAVKASRSASSQSNIASGSIGTMSTVSSLHSARSSAAIEASQNSPAPLKVPAQSSAPDEKGVLVVHVEEAEEVDNDWEFEFMLREAFDIHLRKEETAFLQRLR